MLRDDLLEEVLCFLERAVLHTELLDGWADVFEVHDTLLQDRLQEDDHYAHLTILVNSGRPNRTTLLHAVLNEEKCELFGEVNVVLHPVE